MPDLFSTIKIRDIKFPNRIVISPMQQFAALNGHVSQWHTIHLGSRATGGAGTVFLEMTAVSEDGRSSLADTGIWSNEHIDSLKPLVDTITEIGSIPAIQIGHSGRKGSMQIPFQKRGFLPTSEGGWIPLAPSSIQLDEHYKTPKEMTRSDIQKAIEDFALATKRADKAGFQLLEIHGGHGYLIHQFLSPLSNRRTDSYGGDIDNRALLLKEVVKAVRVNWPNTKPLSLRLSMADNNIAGWQFEDTVWLTQLLKPLGVDIFDCSNLGGLGPGRADQRIVHNTERVSHIRFQTKTSVIAVGGITEPAKANGIISSGKADFVAIARESLRDPYWPQRAATALGHENIIHPRYARAW